MADSVLRREVAADGTKVLVPLEEANHLERMTVLGKGAPLVPGPVNERAFFGALQQRLEGAHGWDWSNLVVLDDEMISSIKAAPPECAFMEYEEDNLPIRWRRFDTGGTQPMSAESTGDADLPGGGFTELQNALAEMERGFLYEHQRFVWRSRFRSF